MDADSKNENLPNDSEHGAPDSKGKDVLAERLAEVQAQLQAMNEVMQAQSAALTAATKKPAPVEEENLYDPNQLLRKAENTFDTRLREERAKDAKIFELSQEYPEIRGDSKIRNDILAAQKELPDHMRDTAIGYEAAVLKAVAKNGLVAKSKRPNQSLDEDASLSSRGGSSNAPRKKVKVNENMLALAELMGIDTKDKKRLEGLEAAANRDRYDKYR